MNYKKSDTKDRNETYLVYVKVHPMSLNKRDTEDAVTKDVIKELTDRQRFVLNILKQSVAKGVVVYPFLF